jgi:hypothetical protein
MKLSMAVFQVIALAAFFAGVADAQQYPPVWTDILTAQQTQPPYTMASGNYYEIGNGLLREASNTDLAGIGYTLTLGVTSLPASGAPAPSPCPGKIGFATSYIESNQGTGITGVGFLGQFNSPGALDAAPYNGQPYNIQFAPDNNLNQSVFFNENKCYGANGVGGQDGPNANGREYGFFLAANDNSIWAYWGTKENQGLASVQDQMPLTAANNVLGNGVTIEPNTPYYFEMYPVSGAYGSCSVETYVYDTNFNLKFAAAPPIGAYGGTNILSVDPHFCTFIASDIGYVSANNQPGPLVKASELPGTNVYNLSMQRVFVGKN